jgi:CheY-like chemotaxis protein
VLLQHFYPDFYRVLIDPRQADPIADFLRYHQLRELAKQGDGLPLADWREFFKAKHLKLPAADEDLTPFVRELEHELPDGFAELAADRNFVDLVASLDGPTNSALRQHLSWRPLTPDIASYSDEPRSGFPKDLRTPLTDELRTGRVTGSDPLAGLRVLWIDDNPMTNRSLTEFLRRCGATVTPVTDRAGALSAFEQTRPDVVLSDFTRKGNVNAGIEDLEYFRVHDVYDGPVIFCSGQRSPALVRRAADLNAEGPTNDENEIIALLGQIAAAMAPDPPSN